MRLVNNSLHFNPHLPEGWELLSFLLRFKGRLLQGILRKDNTEYKLLEGEALEIFENDNAIGVHQERFWRCINTQVD